MTLTLRIRQESGLPAGQAERRLDHGRLVLGRGAESDWVLTDPARTLSKRHCVIEEADLGYEITDLSTNGVFLNDDDEPVGVGNSRRLRHGDRIRLGPYSLSVELSGGEQPALEPGSLGLASSFGSQRAWQGWCWNMLKLSIFAIRAAPPPTWRSCNVLACA